MRLTHQVNQSKNTTTFICSKNLPGHHFTPDKKYQVKLAEFVENIKSQHLIKNDIGQEHYLYDDELENNFFNLREYNLNKLLK
jgi:hypothetical protein